MAAARRHPATILLFVLPMLLVVAAVVLGIVTRQRDEAGPPSVSGPLALPPVDAPDAATPPCTRLVEALPVELPSTDAALPRLPLAPPAPAGAVAWAGPRHARPVVLRCGLPRPPELTPTSALIVVNGVSWLALSEPDRDTFIAVDREIYLALTVPRGLGTGPVQTVSDVVRSTVATR